MTRTQRRQIALLAMTRSLPDFILAQRHKPGRLPNLYRRLKRQTDDLMRLFPKLSDKNTALIREKIERFVDITRLEQKSSHAATMASFLLDALEAELPHARGRARMGLKKIITTLNDIIAYFENRRLPAACCWGGAVRAEKWRQIWDM